jgi:hypothetical protein
MGPSANNPDIKRGILHTRFSSNSPPVFDDATDPLEAEFGLLHYIEYQKTLYAAQQLRGTVGAWWASDIATLPVDHHVPWSEFRTAFRAHHLSVGLLCSKLKEFLDLEQGNHNVFDYTRQFNTLAQYGTCTVQGSPSICRSAWYISLACRIMSW